MRSAKTEFLDVSQIRLVWITCLFLRCLALLYVPRANFQDHLSILKRRVCCFCHSENFAILLTFAVFFLLHTAVWGLLQEKSSVS